MRYRKVIPVLLLLPALGIAETGQTAGFILALTVPLIFVYMAYLLDFRRLYGYALLVAIFMLAAEFISTEAGAAAQVGAGMVALIVGIWRLARFLRAYPMPHETMIYERSEVDFDDPEN